MAVSEREAIAAPEWNRVNPLAAVDEIVGVRVHQVGQGDAISVLGPGTQPAVRIDYGGRGKSALRTGSSSDLVRRIDTALPVPAGQGVFLTHWDEDHWCSARAGAQAETNGAWITPRQLTSPRAVRASQRFSKVACVPETWGSRAILFEARNGDRLAMQKLARFNPTASGEDCNETGLVFAVLRKETREVIFLPGDAPFHAAPLYDRFDPRRWTMRGLCAYHHGSWNHWTSATDAFLHRWARPDRSQIVAFSYAEDNSYGHPHRDEYRAAFPQAKLIDTVTHGSCDILFS